MLSEVFILGFQLRPYLIDVSGLRFCLPAFVPAVPCPYPEESEHIHLVDLLHPPPGVQQGIVGGIDKVMQRQVSVPWIGFSSAAVVGKSDSTSVVCA